MTLIFIVAQWRWLNFHGEKNHRLHRARSMHQSTAKKRPLFMRLISPLLFYAPDLHIRSLRRVFVDHVVIDVDWKVVNERLVKDLQEFLLLVSNFSSQSVSFASMPNKQSYAGRSVAYRKLVVLGYTECRFNKRGWRCSAGTITDAASVLCLHTIHSW